MSAPHAVVVLAAGGSRRLGRLKQMLLRDGETLVHRAVRLAAATRPARLIVVAGASSERIAAAVADLPADVLVNARWETGLAVSLQLAARALAAHAGRVLVLGCDQPALELAHLQALLAGAAHSASGCAATRHGGRSGAPAVLPPSLLQTAAALHGDRGFGQALSALAPGSVFQLHAPELQLDIDTPENEQAAIARGLLDATG